MKSTQRAQTSAKAKISGGGGEETYGTLLLAAAAANKFHMEG